MRSLLATILLMGITISLAGCNLGILSTPGGVAVLDLDEVGTKLGRLELIAQNIDKYSQQQQAGLLELQDKLRSQIAAWKNQLGNKPSQQQLREFRQKSQVLENQLQAALNQVNQQIAEYKAAQIGAFRNEARPIAERLARARGLNVVMLRQESYLWVDSTVDITSEVYAAMAGSKATN